MSEDKDEKTTEEKIKSLSELWLYYSLFEDDPSDIYFQYEHRRIRFDRKEFMKQFKQAKANNMMDDFVQQLEEMFRKDFGLPSGIIGKEITDKIETNFLEWERAEKQREVVKSELVALIYQNKNTLIPFWKPHPRDKPYDVLKKLDEFIKKYQLLPFIVFDVETFDKCLPERLSSQLMDYHDIGRYQQGD